MLDPLETALFQDSIEPVPPARWWVAGVFSTLFPGWGQLYTGRLLLAFVVSGCWWGTWWIALSWLMTPGALTDASRRALAAPFVWWALVVLHAMWDATRRHMLSANPSVRSSWYVSFLSLQAAVGIIGWLWVSTTWIDLFQGDVGVMAPNLLPGDRYLIDRSAYQRRKPENGEVVVFNVARHEEAIHPVDQRPFAPRTQLIMRIIGVPNDTIAVRHGVLYVNENPLKTIAIDETNSVYTDDQDRVLVRTQQKLNGHMFQVLNDPLLHQRQVPQSFIRKALQVPLQRVPKDRYFLMGDHRSYSVDSRYWGTVRRKDLVGPAIRIYYSRDPQTGQTRWERIGLPVP